MEMKGNDKSGNLISQDDIDTLLNSLPTKNKSILAPNCARIILEEDDDENERVDSNIPIPKNIGYKKHGYILKLKWICAPIALACFAAVWSYFIFIGLNPNTIITPRIYRFPIVDPSSQSMGELTNKKENHTSISMKDFVVPAPAMREDLTYLATDIFIDLKQSSDWSKVKKKQVYARAIIYNVFEKALALNKKKNIEKSQLEEAIKTALDDIVPNQLIKKVILKKFRLI